MATYYNPYIPQQSSYSYQAPGMMPIQPVQQAPVQAPMQSNVIGVDGEIGAKAYPIPNGSTGPIALWDTSDNVIYLRHFNAAGMPLPLKKLRYVEEEPMQMLPGQSGSVDTSQFVTKADFEQLRQEIRQMSQQNVPHTNQNGSSAMQNRGGNNQGRQG